MHHELAVSTAVTVVTLLCIIISNCLTLYMTENFGTLADKGSVQLEDGSGSRLVGSYGNAVTGMSATTLALGSGYLAMFFVGWYRKRHQARSRQLHVYWLIMTLAVTLGLTSAAVTLGLTESFQKQTHLEFSPVPVEGENFKLRGAYGKATLGMSSCALGMSGIAAGWLTYNHVQDSRNSHNDTASRLDFSMF